MDYRCSVGLLLSAVIRLSATCCYQYRSAGTIGVAENAAVFQVPVLFL